MKKLILTLSIVLVGIIILCGCNKTSQESNTTNKAILGQEVIENNPNNFVSVYLKIDGSYLYMDEVVESYVMATGENIYTIRVCRQSQKRSTQCCELTQYDNYFTITLIGRYEYNEKTKRYTYSSSGTIYHKQIKVSNNIGSYEIVQI